MARLSDRSSRNQAPIMEVEEIREQLQAAQRALEEAMKADRRARAKAMCSGNLDVYLRGTTEVRAVATARSDFVRMANFLVVATMLPATGRR